jgi:hypothetical protein
MTSHRSPSLFKILGGFLKPIITQKGRSPMKSARQLLMAMMTAILMISLLPMQAVQAQEETSSEVVISLVSIPKHVKACETFAAVYTITNLGPDPAGGEIQVNIPDAFDVVSITGVPELLAVGEMATITVYVKVTLFVPGEMRYAWVTVGATNTITTEMKIIGKHIECPLP